MSLGEALQPAIEIARDGFLVDQIFFGQIQGNVDFFDDITSTRALYLDPDGTPRDVGTTFPNPDMARTYEHGGSTVSWPTYVTSVVYWGDVMENWQSEFLQRRLTRESRAVSSPAWSPDGRVS